MDNKLQKIKDIALNSEREAIKAADKHIAGLSDMYSKADKRLARANFIHGWMKQEFQDIIKIIEE